MGQELYITAQDGENINLVFEKPGGQLDWGIDLSGSDLEGDLSTPLVIMLHDAPMHNRMSHESLLSELARMLSLKGVPSISFDFRGCGDSDGMAEALCIDTMVEDIMTAILWATEEQKFKKLFFVACGSAAAPLLPLLVKRPDLAQILGIALFWPVLQPSEWGVLKSVRESGPARNERGETLDYGLYNGRKIGLTMVDQIEKLSVMKALTLLNMPVLIQQGTADEVVPMSQLDIVRESAGAKYLDLQIYEAAGHGLEAANLRPHVLRTAHDFIMKFI